MRTIKKVIYKQVCIGILEFLLLLAGGTIFTILGVKTGIIVPANYSEIVVEQSKHLIKNAEKVDKSMFPSTCKFGFFSSDGKYHYGNFNNKDINIAADILVGKRNNILGNQIFRIFQSKHGTCIVKYNIKSYIKINGKVLEISYDSLLIIIIMFGLIFIIGANIKILVRNWKGIFKEILFIAENIKEKRLDYPDVESNIKEFNDVFCAMRDIKDALKKSLKEQWELEANKIKQIAALAHDIKIPLTIIRGNAGLISSDDENKEIRKYIEYIENSSIQIEDYVNELIDMSKINFQYNIKKEEINIKSLLDQIKKELELYKTSDKNIISVSCNSLVNTFCGDKLLISRAILNVATNSLDFITENGCMYIYCESNNDYIEFIIKDNGPGFSKDALNIASELFYTENVGRISNGHYGIGLAFAKDVCKVHGGNMILSNSKEYGGAKVILRFNMNSDNYLINLK